MLSSCWGDVELGGRVVARLQGLSFEPKGIYKCLFKCQIRTHTGINILYADSDIIHRWKYVKSLDMIALVVCSKMFCYVIK